MRHDGMYRLLALWDSAGDSERVELYKLAVRECPDASRAPALLKTDAATQIATILLGVRTSDHALCAAIDTALLATDAEKAAFGCFATQRLPPLIDALHQGALAQHVADHTRELDLFCAAAVHAWMCEV